ncbi:MAG: MarR family transcriptional regulator [Oscillospiraceae bacterium]|nr:MarR family transcriptional regulator [Oscillospiraceae bacterium]
MEWSHSREISQYLQLHRAITTRYDRVLTAAAQASGLTKPEADVLLFLANNPQFRTARDVAAYRGFSKTYVSKSLERLTRRGLVTARTDPADRRVLNLTLTDAAAGPVRQLQSAQRAFFQRLTDGIPRSDAGVLRRMMARVQENLTEL